MSLTPNEAASALRDIEDTGRRSGQAFGYRLSAPHLIIWGLVWVVGYGGTDLAPRLTNMVVVFWAFLIATYSIMQPGPREQGAFVPLAIAAIYAGVGLWLGVRYVLLGAAVAGLTLLGYFEIQQHFYLWMAAVGGGGLIVSGLWMRSA